MMQSIVLLLLGTLISMSLGCSNGTSFSVQPEEDDFGSSILYNNKVDIIWVVDDSSSMQQYQVKLSNEIPAMIERLNSLGMDYRMVVSTTSVGLGFAGGTHYGEPKVLSNSTPNLADVLRARLVRGQNGSQLERGILSLQNMLSENYLQNEGAGFHRDEALLLINFLSDDDDQTDGTADSVVQSLVARLNQMKKPFRPNVGGWLVNYIGVIDNQQCSNSMGGFNIGHRYLDLVTRSNGKKYPICTTNLFEAVKGLQARVLEIITDYSLSRQPDVSTIKVYKNGVLIPKSRENGWDYIAELNVIRFFGSAIPAVDSNIRVEFTPASAG